VIVRQVRERRGWVWRVAVPIVRFALLLTTKPNWRDGTNIPAEGGCLLVVNHISEVDPFVVAHLVWNHGRVPRYLAKAGLFHNRLFGYLLRNLGQIPVERASRNAAGAFTAAVEAVRRGEVVIVYPEGTLTRDPDLWPMTAKSGAARIALETGCPVIPIGQWGAQRLLAPYASRPDLFPRKRIDMVVGEPVDLSELEGQNVTPALIDRATDTIMDAITAQVAEARGETPPAVRFDSRAAGVAEFGNPNRSRKDPA
jgi:1-acyl-sn-glycerol-3-phosphate acyltransferase